MITLETVRRPGAETEDDHGGYASQMVAAMVETISLPVWADPFLSASPADASDDLELRLSSF